MLLEFYGTECEHCHAMEPLVDRLEKETGVTLEKFEVWHNEDNAKEMKTYDKNRCGGVPFFYNTENGKFICGETSYEKLKEWAFGEAQEDHVSSAVTRLDGNE